MTTDEEKSRNARWQANVWNAKVDQILARIKARGYERKPWPEWDDDYEALREARRNAGYWNQIVNRENGYI